MNFITYLLQVKVPRHFSVLVFFVLFFICYTYLYFLGLGIFNSMAYCVHGVNSTCPEYGHFVPSEGTAKEIDCKKFNRMFPEFTKLQNAVPKPQLTLDSKDGQAVQFYKVDKSIINTKDLSLKNRCSLALVGSEPKCFQVLGKFVKQVLHADAK